MLMESGGEVAAKAISDACGTKVLLPVAKLPKRREEDHRGF